MESPLPIEATTIADWLDMVVKPGFGGRFARAFHEYGVEDPSDLTMMDEEDIGEIERLLDTLCSAKPFQRKLIRRGVDTASSHAQMLRPVPISAQFASPPPVHLTDLDVEPSVSPFGSGARSPISTATGIAEVKKEGRAGQVGSGVDEVDAAHAAVAQMLVLRCTNESLAAGDGPHVTAIDEMVPQPSACCEPDAVAAAPSGPATDRVPVDGADGHAPQGLLPRMEVMYSQEGLAGCWYEVELLRPASTSDQSCDGAAGPGTDSAVDSSEGAATGASTGGLALVRHLSDGSEEWVPAHHLRPSPPRVAQWATPPTDGASRCWDWSSKLAVGDFVDLHYQGGWWEVQVLSKHASSTRFHVVALRYSTQHEVKSDALRPCWRYSPCHESSSKEMDGSAVGGWWRYALGGQCRTASQWEGNFHRLRAKWQAATRPCGLYGCTRINHGGYQHMGVCSFEHESSVKRARDVVQYHTPGEGGRRGAAASRREHRKGAAAHRRSGKRQKRKAQASLSDALPATYAAAHNVESNEGDACMMDMACESNEGDGCMMDMACAEDAVEGILGLSSPASDDPPRGHPNQTDDDARSVADGPDSESDDDDDDIPLHQLLHPPARREAEGVIRGTTLELSSLASDDLSSAHRDQTDDAHSVTDGPDSESDDDDEDIPLCR